MKLIEVAHAGEERASSVSTGSPDHGPRHWRDVARVAHAIWAEGVDVNARLLFCFAALHDTQRDNEFEDPDHGRRAWEVAKALDLPLDTGEWERLKTALCEHNEPSTNDDDSVGACLDADRLTLWRVGIEPEVAFISHDVIADNFNAWREIGRRIVTGPDHTWEEIAQAYEREQPLDTLVSVLHPEANQDNGAYAMLRQMTRGGELCEELAACLVEPEDAIPFVMHPLVHQPYFAQQAAHFNDVLRKKREWGRKARAEGNYYSFVFNYERPYRAQAFLEISPELAEKCEHEWWDLLASVWTDSENLWQEHHTWRELLEFAPEGGHFTGEDDKEAWEKLPDEITVHRGTNAPDGMGCGMSWTLNEQTAKWFATRLDRGVGEAQVHVGKVAKEDVIGFTNARGENEIVALPDHVEVDHIYTVEEVASERS